MATGKKPMAECLTRAQGFEFYKWLSGQAESDVLDGLMSWSYPPDAERRKVGRELLDHYLAAFPEPKAKGDPFERVYARLDLGPQPARFRAFACWLEEKGAKTPGEKVDSEKPEAAYTWAWNVMQRLLRGSPAYSTRAGD